MAGTEYQKEVRAMASVVALLFTLFAIGSCTSQVPFVMWSSGGLPPMSPPPAGHITTTDQLVKYIKTAFSSAPCTVLLFLQDKLSKDDFTVFGGVFGNKADSVFQNLEAALHSASSLVLPSVEWSSSSTVPALLQEQLGVSPLLVDADTLSDLPLNASVCTFLIINLPYNTDNKFPKEVLRNNDEIIGKVRSIMEAKNIPYTAIYTGLQPSRVIAQTSMSMQPVGRSLLQTVEPPVKAPIIFNVSGSDVPCIMLWAKNLTVSFTGPAGPWIDLATQTPTVDGSLCNDTISLLVLTYASGITLSFSMTKRFYPVSARNWSIVDTVLLENGAQNMSFSSRHIYTPAEYSFSCQSVKSYGDGLLVPNVTTTLWRVNFTEFQIQGFGLTNGNFSYASDCAGFFTAGIWMGLLTSLLMLWIFFYGLHMIMQINTMDRFDDPKGPSIAVPQSE